MIDRDTYITMVIRCLLLEIEVQALRRVRKHTVTDAECALVAYLRDEEARAWRDIGERFSITYQGAQGRYKAAVKRGLTQ